jgi:hypothetical protein
MFSSNTISDTIDETISRVFRIPGNDRPISTFQLAGIPSEVVNSVASVLCRMAFEIALWSKGAIHILVVCEEAHRYVPADPTLGFFPTRQAIARIAKEGRKYGASLCMITQRPGELDQTILSQCSTLFAMRLSNDRDQEIIRKAIPDSSMSSMNFISSLANGEAIAFGEALPVPMRLKFDRVDDDHLPRAHGNDVSEMDDPLASVNLSAIIERMRTVQGPDISDFQSRITAMEASVQAAVFVDGEDNYDTLPLQDRDMDSLLEPYNPAMLPGQAKMTPETPSFRQDTRYDRYASLLNKDIKPPMPERTSPVPQVSEPGQGNGGRSGNETAMSLRESILKRPIGSLLKR